MIRSALSIAGLAASLAAQTPVIIDTDAGNDDLMAIAFLLSRKDVTVEAITIVDGLAHVPVGAANVLRLLEAAGAARVPVYAGREAPPLQRTAPFPSEWRQTADVPPGVSFPSTRRKPEPVNAVDFLAARLGAADRPVRILALGPLTNLGEVFRRQPRTARSITELVIMGGAVRERGNLGDGGFFKTTNTTAEWNLFHDPLAAEIVFRSGVPLRLIPLDATNKVPIDLAFLRELASRARSPLGRVVTQILETARPHIEQKFYFAWDPLAAVALVDPAVVTVKQLSIEVRRNPPEEGRTKQVSGRPNASVAVDADPARFRKTFLAVFE
jgi:pyrimidine-specific ribonucleoside hydrolase